MTYDEASAAAGAGRITRSSYAAELEDPDDAALAVPGTAYRLTVRFVDGLPLASSAGVVDEPTWRPAPDEVSANDWILIDGG